MSHPTRELAAFVSALDYEDLPERLRGTVRRCFLDTVGCGLYGSGTASGRILAAHARSAGGAGEATLWGEGWRGPAEGVALCLGTMMHAFELDDYHSGAKLHPGAVVFAAAIPLAEKLGAGGRAFAAAVAAGYEAMIRAGLAAGAVEVRRRGFHLTGLCGPFGAAAAACRLLGMDPERTANALGLAGAQAGGTWAFQCDGSETKRFHAGRAAQSGLLAAALAQRGYTGPTEIFEYEDGGFIAAYGGKGEPGRLTAGLGRRWECEGVSFKAYCCCGSTHSTIDAVLSLREKHGLRPGDVEEIEIFNHSVVRQQCSWRYEPVSPLKAQMCIEYCAAAALADGAAGPEQFSVGRIADPALVALARRARFTVDPGIERVYPAAFPGKVVIRTRDGRELRGEVPGPKGSPQNPMTFEEVSSKFRRLTAPLLDPEVQESLIRAAEGLDEAGSLREVAGRLGEAGALAARA